MLKILKKWAVNHRGWQNWDLKGFQKIWVMGKDYYCDSKSRQTGVLQLGWKTGLVRPWWSKRWVNSSYDEVGADGVMQQPDQCNLGPHCWADDDDDDDDDSRTTQLHRIFTCVALLIEKYCWTKRSSSSSELFQASISSHQLWKACEHLEDSWCGRCGWELRPSPAQTCSYCTVWPNFLNPSDSNRFPQLSKGMIIPAELFWGLNKIMYGVWLAEPACGKDNQMSLGTQPFQSPNTESALWVCWKPADPKSVSCWSLHLHKLDPSPTTTPGELSMDRLRQTNCTCRLL